MDQIIAGLFDTHLGDARGLALFAVGGYGRQELHPGSDIDLLILTGKPQKFRSAIEAFLQSVWDLNIEVGHSVRDLRSCYNESKADITVATAMFERRFLCGDASQVPRLDRVMRRKRLWPAADFFSAKLDEQETRHRHYDDTEYNLEPNVKTSPGALRDIHTTLWICRRKFDTTDPDRLCALGALTRQEATWLIEGRRFIWWVRFGLHLIAGRKEDRLQFTYQRELAQRLGFADTDAQRGVERFMHHYYRHVLALTEVNDILLQHFREVILAPRRQRVQGINARFKVIDGYLAAMQDDTFTQHPAALLEMFVIMAHRRDIPGVRAATIRQVRESLHLIDDAFRANPEHAQLFQSLLKSPYNLVSQLTRMRRYGLLGRYIPEFGRVIGQMQHDLFHIYTVDAHTMMVVRNMRLFRHEASREEYPVAYHCVHNIPKPELLYIAGLYHDIGKGRGGDHSTLGAKDAREFCARHALSEADTDLVCWLVAKHLYMSSVAQRADIYDPDVVHKFATEVKSEMRLDYLYALTVADINATNPTLWNSWRATLMRHLYTETRRTLRRGLESAADRQVTIAAYQDHAREHLQTLTDATPAAIDQLWAELGDDFFLRHSARQLAELSAALLAHDPAEPFVAIRDTPGDLPGEGATRIYVYTRDQPLLFAKTVVAISRFDLSVFDATVNTSTNGMCFDIYTVLDEQDQPLSPDPALRRKISTGIADTLASDKPVRPSRKRLPRQLRELPTRTEVTLQPSADGITSTLTIIASDRPGLLASLGEIFRELELLLCSAKITTLGERVEDTFLIQDSAGQPITDTERIYMLEQTIRQRLDTEVAIAS